MLTRPTLACSEGDGTRGIAGCWDSVHVVDVSDVQEGQRVTGTTYKLTSTIMLWLETNKESTGLFNLGGNMTRQVPHS